jgi:hypothetical protein
MIVVHIGLPKSGTTTIQGFLYDNGEALRALSIDYPRVGREDPGRSRAHHNFANELAAHGGGFNPSVGRLSDLVRHVIESNHRCTILSSERFCQLTPDAVCRFVDILRRTGQNIQVVFVIRDLVDLIPSSYSQSIRFGYSTHDFDKFFRKRSKSDRTNQYLMAKSWADVIGWKAVRVRPLNIASLRRGDLIDDFLATAGLDPDAPPMTALKRPSRLNESAGWKTTEAVRACFDGRAALPESHPLSHFISADRTHRAPKRIGLAAEAIGIGLGWNKEKGQYLTLEQAEDCLSTYLEWVKDLNMHLERKVEEPLTLQARNFVERRFLPDVTHIDPADLRAFYDAWGESLTRRKALFRGAVQTDPET